MGITHIFFAGVEGATGSNRGGSNDEGSTAAHGKQLIFPVGGARSARPNFNDLAIYVLLTCAKNETDGEKMMERTPTEETSEGNKETSFGLSDGTLANTFVCFAPCV